MELFLCSECNREFNDYSSFRKHNSFVHKIKSEETFIKYRCGGLKPTCACGCNKPTKFISENRGFSKFVNGHNSSTSDNNFHKDPKTKIKSAKTQSENWKNGKYKGWWENDDKETKDKIETIKEKLRNDKKRGEKISKALKGIPKSDKHKKNCSISQIKRYSENPELRNVLKKRRIKWLKRKLKNPTKLEIKFKNIFGLIGLVEGNDYEFQYEFKNRLFDFFIIGKKILIEVDGDFYHCNPESEHKTPTYKVQELTVINDTYKNMLCIENQISLYRFWEKDINERPEWVISELKKILEN